MQRLPQPGQFASFKPGFTPRSLLTVDTEEEFDWSGDFSRDAYSLEHVRHLARFQEFCEEIGVSPVYLIDWPIAHSRIARDILGDACARGAAEIGIQLHPWVNPPFEEEIGSYNSYAGNLPPHLEREKLLRLRDAIAANFDCTPLIYRAGRYGTGTSTAKWLRQAGIAIDSSVRSGFDYSAGNGPSYAYHPLRPWWIGEDRSLLELPVTTVFWGPLRKQASWIYPRLGRLPGVTGGLARLGLLERIPLTPEGVTVEEALRGIDIALDDGLPVTVLSFHSPSLAPGHTPYVRSEVEVEALYEWFRQVYAYLAQRGAQPTTVEEIMANVDL